MSEQSSDTKEGDATKQTRGDIIREFCRSQRAPTAYWLARLSRHGQRECIRQWIIRSRSPEIYSKTHAVVEQVYEEHANKDPYFYDAPSAEDLMERVERARRHARELLDEEIRYGAICRD